jgi:hypothetical protein
MDQAQDRVKYRGLVSTLMNHLVAKYTVSLLTGSQS